MYKISFKGIIMKITIPVCKRTFRQPYEFCYLTPTPTVDRGAAAGHWLFLSSIFQNWDVGVNNEKYKQPNKKLIKDIL
jgi:hypothetical protein